MNVFFEYKSDVLVGETKSAYIHALHGVLLDVILTVMVRPDADLITNQNWLVNTTSNYLSTAHAFDIRHSPFVK